MPNWVSNSVRVTGEKEDLQRFAEQAGRSYSRKYQDIEGKWYEAESNNEHLSFWNFVRPDDSILDEYWGLEQQLPLEERLQHKTNHWYDWNIRNWGVKWDASSVYFEDWDGELCYDFETPWGFPEEALRAMVEQYPTLNFTVRFLEEQGWGGEAVGFDGDFAIVNEWDIPDTHEECVEYVGYCKCEEMREDEVEWMYDDCPKKMEVANA